MRRPLVILLALLFLAGCAGGGEGPGDGSAAAPPQPSLSDGTRESAPADAQPTARKEIVTGYLVLRADDPIAAGRQVVTLVEAAGGRVDSVTEQPGTSSVLTVRVPADRLTGTIEDIRGLGDVTSLTTTREDVTLQYTDLEARIAALQSSVDRLRALMASAANTADLIEAENALAQRQSELDGLVAQQRYLADQIELSTLTVDISAERRADRDSFWDGVLAGWDALRSALAGSVVALGVALPWVGFLAVCAAVVYVIVRLLARRGKPEPVPNPERNDQDA
ncbi:DUF4349 domain-containing protein [Rhodococcus sp. GXMU-t2271]|uniref:DUF4349 domain-containing protein n=1 Tax=Rhodococcus indonesiensis TaxID=3055869 RepID=A0ABT7RRN2_9NOCA|nr:DUF4349 domain-containing protein [Rhodococcus indonesiensis]MDM7490275.1 DUF4349 domain-containing protein [Rhodococcus indonesiensis]